MFIKYKKTKLNDGLQQRKSRKGKIEEYRNDFEEVILTYLWLNKLIHKPKCSQSEKETNKEKLVGGNRSVCFI